MNDINLRSIDLNLMTVFEGVYEERHQTRAAERLAMTQPSVSHAMARLRHLMQDPLFVARGRTLLPTTRADALYLRVHEALGLLRSEFRARHQFIPQESIRTFVTSMSHGGGALLGPKVARQIQALAPKARLVVRLIDPEEEIPRLLREHSLDLACHHRRLEDPMLEHLPIGCNEPVLVVASDHPRICAESSLEELLQERFVMVHESLIQTENTELVDFLNTINVVIEIPFAGQLANYIESSELVGLTIRSIAESFSHRFQTRTLPLPISLKPQPTYLIWHRSKSDDPEHQWFRELSVATFQGQG